MSIDVTTDIESKYVRVSCKGSFNNKELLSIYDKALDLAADKGRKAILVDVRDLEGALPATMDRFYHGVTTVTIQRAKKTRIFIAVLGREPLLDPERFGETVALNRGLLGKAFIDIDDAIAWIDKNVIK
ncbi:hypothetical protein D1AOALGA4SA_6399 [Olavius algarvensis Delta 1 endosymbiont]|nr:hypothetical protein D1AOALGA4SA_6399 [Olavius algarvensis Delta 1 endosymbiont]